MLILAFFTFIIAGCKKDKLDNKIPLLNVANNSASSIRLFNYYGDAQVTVNNIPLTAYSTNNGSTGGTALGLTIFPDGIWANADNGSPFLLPNSLLDKDGKAHLSISSGATKIPLMVDTTIVNNVGHPQDYYLMPNGHIRVLDRDNLPPANPQNFKIRVINLGSNVYGDPLGLNLNGPVSLTYADGSLVDPALSNVAQGVSSRYIEMPYGSYQFKLFIANGAIDINRQLAELPNVAYYDPCNPGSHPQQGISPRVRTFKPGGVYSIVVTENLQPLFIECDRYTSGFNENSYRVITELDPGVNSTYARMQAVNAIPGKQVTISVDGKSLGDRLPYIGLAPSGAAQQATYQIYVQGEHHIQAIDQSGAVLAEGDLKLFPYDNYTIWAYNQPDGKPALLFEANDMSGTLYKTSHLNGTGVPIPDDGTNGTSRISKYNYALQSRFLNLSPDLPYATFTNDHQLFLPAMLNADTIRYFSSYVNLASGTMPLRNASMIYSLPPVSPGQTSPPVKDPGTVPQLIRVYQSAPGSLPEIPGALLTNVAPINVYQTFIANPNLYTSAQQQKAETGVYTVALVGKTTSTQASDQAKLIVIKHNK
eukprot:gene2882-3308_t